MKKIFLSGLIIIFSVTPFISQAQEPPSPYAENAINGIVQSKQKAMLSFAQKGFIILVPEEGQKVQQGDVMAKLNNKSLSLAVTEAEAFVESNRLSVEVAKHKRNKTKRLIDEKILSKIAIKEDTFSLEQAKANLKQTEASLQSALLAVEQTKMTAPFDGYVLNVTANFGEQITAGEPIAELINLQSLQLTTDVPQSVSQTLKEGTTSAVWLDGQKIGTATVRAIIPALEVGTGLQKVIWDIQADVDMLTGNYVTLSPMETKE